LAIPLTIPYWVLWLVSILAIPGTISVSGNCALAQVIPDSTLGIESSIVKFSGNTYAIEGGVKRGPSLFHSFEQFSVPKDGLAIFNNTLDIQNIISRVTGPSMSHINGTLKAEGTANLFLINPNGIIFGTNASLKIGGSFLASTASSLKFADGTQFSATASQTAPLLTTSVPIGLQFAGTVGRISNRSMYSIISSSGKPVVVGLQVIPGGTLALVGGDVSFDGGRLQAQGGQVELGAVDSFGTVGLSVDANDLHLSFPEGLARADISLANASQVNVNSEKGIGNVEIQGKNVVLTSGSQIIAANGSGGQFTINASDSVKLTGSNSGLFSVGDIKVTARRLVVQDGAGISTGVIGIGNPAVTGPYGDLTVNASESVELTGGFLTTSTRSVRNAGNLTISTGQLYVQGKNSQLTVSSGGLGAAGNLEITALSIILLNSQSALSAENSVGERGNIILHTQDLQLRNSSITTQASNNANSGNINIDTGTLVALQSSKITADAQGGQGGNIHIKTQGLIRSPDSSITAMSERSPQLNGVVEINTLVNNPSQGLVTLPIEPVNITGQIAQGCPAGVGPRASKFVVTGHGGLPPDPTEALRSEPTLADLGTTVQSQERRTSATTSSNLSSSDSAPLVEAQGWVTNAKGEVELVAQLPTVTLHIPWLAPTICQATYTAS